MRCDGGSESANQNRVDRVQESARQSSVRELTQVRTVGVHVVSWKVSQRRCLAVLMDV